MRPVAPGADVAASLTGRPAPTLAAGAAVPFIVPSPGTDTPFGNRTRAAS
ncbi:hypothetical protein A33M_0767 [Rhodovulum sp. PH10]|nr:hypothetical protein A33M_0767 [Rhodovulum sp. PH10]